MKIELHIVYISLANINKKAQFVYIATIDINKLKVSSKL